MGEGWRDPQRAPRLGDREFRIFQSLIYREAGIHLSDAKRQLVEGRLSRRLRHLGLGTYEDYARLLSRGDAKGEERVAFVNALTTNKTHFFREPHHFEVLTKEIVPALEARPGKNHLRIWSAGCSTGEEPWTVAMALREAFGAMPGWEVRILATDIDTEVLGKARAAIYPEDRLADVPLHLRRRYFLRGTGGYAGQWQVRPELRRMVEFDQLNLQTPFRLPFKPDVIFCRNVIIYFDRDTQRRLLDRMADQMDPQGWLVLGHSENITGISERFSLLRSTVHRVNAAAAGRTVEPPLVRIGTGEVRASASPLRISTVLGSCVSACLYDPAAQVGGMNHFMLPGPSADDPREGPEAMARLLAAVESAGGRRRHLEAKVFGATRAPTLDAAGVGAENARFVREWLTAHGIPLRAERLGGDKALEVHFLTHTGKALVRQVEGAGGCRTGAGNP